MASRAFLQGFLRLFKADIDFDTVAFKVMLLAAAPSVANLDTWANRAAVTGEFSATGYTAGGVAQGFTLNAVDTTNHKLSVTLANIANAWTGVTWPAPPLGAVIYANLGSAAEDIPLWWVEFSSVTAPAGGQFPINYTSNAEFSV